MKIGKEGIYRFLLLCIGVISLSVSGCSRLPAEHEIVTATDGRIVIPADKVNDGKVHFFTYKKAGKRINFFIRTTGTGNLSAYFDACYTCYKNRKGYRVEGNDLICNECNLKFALSEEVWENKDCRPIKIRSSVEGKNLILDVSSVEKGARLF
jgi:uncharacterized membrane protein